MGVLYGLVAAVFWGTADFAARMATQTVGSRRTVFWMQLVGLCCTGTALLFPATWPSWPSDRAVALAMGIGLLNLFGALLLYRALEIGTVSLVSPISSCFAAIAAGLALVAGERPGPTTLAGLALTALGVAGASLPPSSGAPSSGSRRGLGLAAGSAVCWGISFFALRYVVRDLGGLFPVWISRGVAVLVLSGAAVVQRRPVPRPAGAWLWVVVAGVTDSGAFVAYNLGVATSLTAVVTVLSSLFSAVTVLLALIFLKERLSAPQWASVAVILVGVGLVSAGG